MPFSGSFRNSGSTLALDRNIVEALLCLWWTGEWTGMGEWTMEWIYGMDHGMGYGVEKNNIFNGNIQLYLVAISLLTYS